MISCKNIETAKFAILGGYPIADDSTDVLAPENHFATPCNRVCNAVPVSGSIRKVEVARG